MRAQEITFGVGEKLTANSIELDATGTLTVGDLNAQTIALRGTTVAVQARDAAADSAGEIDQGANWIANTISVDAATLSDGGQPIVFIGTPNAGSGDLNLTGGASLAQGNFVARAAFEQIGTQVREGDLFRDDGTALDLTPGGASRGSERAPRNPLPIDIQRPSSASNRQAVSERPLRESEIAAFLACDPEDMECQEAAVGDARANSEEAKQLRASFEALFGAPSSPAAAKMADENPRRAALQAAVDAFRAETGQRPAGVSFRQFVESRPDQAAALATLDELRQLFTSARQFGMTGEGIGNFKQQTLQEVQPTGITLDDLDAAVEAGGLNPDESSAGIRPPDPTRTRG